jgi:isopenicillin N synthase-like dioxygenase
MSSPPRYAISVARPLTTVSLQAWRDGDRGERAAISAELDAAATDPGIFLLEDAGVSQTVLDDVVAASRAFFALADVDKRAYEDPVDQFAGYRGPDGNRNEYGAVDLKEMFHIGPKNAPTLVPFTTATRPLVGVVVPLVSSGLWPSVPADFVSSWHHYFRAMQALALDLLDLFAATLEVPAEELRQLAIGNVSDLAANYYPVADGPDAQRSRNAAHADNTVFTVIYQDGDDDGLAVEWRDGTWTPVSAGGTSFVVNVGVLFETLTAGRWRAAPHQVVPRADAVSAGARARLTIPFFFRPHLATRLAPLSPFRSADVEPILMEEWLSKWKAAHAAPLDLP